MKLFCTLLILLIGLAAPAQAEDPDTPDFHFGELPTYRETGPGGTRLTHALLFAPQFFSTSYVAGRDDTFNRRALLGIDFLTMRYEMLIEHRLTRHTSLLVRPTASVGWGYLSVSNHELFELETLGTQVEREADLKVSNVTADLGVHLGLRMGAWEPYVDYRFIYGHRRQKVSTDHLLYTDNSSGVIDRVLEASRTEEEEVKMHSWAIGLGLHFGEEPWNYSLGVQIHPENPVTWKGVTSKVWGGGIVLRADSLRLTDDSALYLILRWDFFFPNGIVNDTHHFEFGIGVRFS